VDAVLVTAPSRAQITRVVFSYRRWMQIITLD
jgi:hypothetical protein